MAATFPGRTHGLGLVTEAILLDLALDRTLYGYFNLWATLLGALFCIPVGYLLDRYGCRNVLAATLVLLALSVLAMSIVYHEIAFFMTLVLTRGFGQSALAVASITLISKTFPKHRLGLSMGVYSVLTTLGFIIAFGLMGAVLNAEIDWRLAWSGIGLLLLAVYVPMVLLCVRKHEVPPEEENIPTEDAVQGNPQGGVPFARALRTQEFWLFALSISFFGLVSSGIGLFNEDILRERGFDAQMYRFLLVFGLPFGLLGNLLFGILARYIRLPILLTVLLLLTGLSALLFPSIQTEFQIYAYTVALSFTGGGFSVMFFIVWAHQFGWRDVGRIQGAAQMLTIIASALGPIVFAYSVHWTQSYTLAFYLCGTLTLMFTIWAARLALSKSPSGTTQPNGGE